MELMKSKDVVNLIKSNNTLAISGFAGVSVPEKILKDLEERYICKKEPENLTLMFAAGQGDGCDKGLNHLAHEGLIKKILGAHFNLAPKLGKLILDNKVKAYNIPQGVMCNIFRDIARKTGYTISRIGLNTFVDPRIEGGKTNSITKEDYIKLINLNGEDILLFPHEKIDFAFIKGSYSDKYGNISMEHEATYSEAFIIAQAVKNCGGKVIVQVDNVIRDNKIECQKVKIPGIYVDYVVEAENEVEKEQIFGLGYNGHLSGEINEKVNIKRTNSYKSTKLTPKQIIGKRGAMELSKGDIVNIGIGIPEEVAKEAEKNGMSKFITLTVEPGAIGGIPQGGIKFGTSYNPDCIIDQASQFDFYDGGGIDICFLGMAECDRYGNVNVSKFGNKLPGCGGFINITQNSKKIVFCGTFTTGGLEVNIQDGKMKIEKEGRVNKFINNVRQITFSGKRASKNKQDVMYITERAVFRLFEDGIHLIEVAPGVDLQNDILNLAEFKIIIDSDFSVMDEKCFM